MLMPMYLFSDIIHFILIRGHPKLLKPGSPALIARRSQVPGDLKPLEDILLAIFKMYIQRRHNEIRKRVGYLATHFFDLHQSRQERIEVAKEVADGRTSGRYVGIEIFEGDDPGYTLSGKTEETCDTGSRSYHFHLQVLEWVCDRSFESRRRENIMTAELDRKGSNDSTPRHRSETCGLICGGGRGAAIGTNAFWPNPKNWTGQWTQSAL